MTQPSVFGEGRPAHTTLTSHRARRLSQEAA
jgi:hypothetical protein